MAQRTDIHRPSAIDPTQYTFIAELDLSDEQDELDQRLVDAIGRNSPHGSPRRCAHCGAVLRYVAVMQHTDGLVGWGFDCLDTLGKMTGAIEAKLRRLKIARQARETERQNAELRAKFAAEHPELHAFMQDALADPHDHLEFVVDVSRRWNQHPEWGLSERQLASMEKCRVGRLKFLAKRAEREAQDAEAEDAPVTNERLKVRGKVISTKYHESEFGGRYVMTVKAEAGWRCWGTIPGDWMPDDLDGRTVEFMARLEPSDDDPKFAFFKRPTKLEVKNLEEERKRWEHHNIRPEGMPF